MELRCLARRKRMRMRRSEEEEEEREEEGEKEEVEEKRVALTPSHQSTNERIVFTIFVENHDQLAVEVNGLQSSPKEVDQHKVVQKCPHHCTHNVITQNN